MSNQPRVLAVTGRPAALQALDGLEERFSTSSIGGSYDIGGALTAFGPDVVLVDTTLSDGRAFDVIEEVGLHSPGTPILAITGDPASPADVAVAARAGAHGFVVADSPDLVAAIDALVGGQSWYPAHQTRQILSAVADDLDTTTAERRSKLTGVILALVPLTGLLAALQSGFSRRYMGHIGVRPVDIAVDPASRVIDALVAILFVVGVVGPLLFVGNWVDRLRSSSLNRGPLTGLLRHRNLAVLALSLAWLGVAGVMAIGPDLGIIAVVGPIVTISIFAKALGVNEELPALLRIEGISTTTTIAGALVVLLGFVTLLAYETIVVGPDLRSDGIHGIVAPRVLGVGAYPMEAVNVNTDERRQVLYLGGNADLYVFVDPCDGNRVDYVSVGAHQLTVIDEITCPS